MQRRVLPFVDVPSSDTAEKAIHANVWRQGLKLLVGNAGRNVMLLKQHLQGSFPTVNALLAVQQKLRWHPTEDSTQDDAGLEAPEDEVAPKWRVMLRTSGWRIEESDQGHYSTVQNDWLRVVDCYGQEKVRAQRNSLYRAFIWLSHRAAEADLADYHEEPGQEQNDMFLLPGDHIVAKFPGFTHHGIYIGDDKVIHFSSEEGKWGLKEVREDTLGDFMAGCSDNTVYVEHHLRDTAVVLPRHRVVARARRRLGERGYALLHNNCEHFARWCKLNKHESNQVELGLTVASKVAAVGMGLGLLWLATQRPSGTHRNKKS